MVGDTVERFQSLVLTSTTVSVILKIAGGVFAVPGVHVLSGISLGGVDSQISSFKPNI